MSPPRLHHVTATSPPFLAAVAQSKQCEWGVGGYVRVVGNLRSFNSKVSIQAYTIRPVLDHNEVTSLWAVPGL